MERFEDAHDGQCEELESQNKGGQEKQRNGHSRKRQWTNLGKVCLYLNSHFQITNLPIVVVLY